jgi:thymidine phosphorylase
MNKFKNSIELLSSWRRISKFQKVNCCNEIIKTAKERELSVEEIKILSNGLAKSGEIWNWTDEISPTIDICSTGGAGSLTTLLSPFLIASQGIFAPQVSVQGSIAGAIDTLGIIPDYKLELKQNEMETALKNARIGNTLNTDELAPADISLFKQRIKKNAKNLPDLVIASLLSKKICSGVKNVIVDVRVGPLGNFGNCFEDTEKNCKKFVSVGKSMEINCICILTNHNTSPMPLYGRLESLAAMWSLANDEVLDVWTNEHIETCIEVAAYGVAATKEVSIPKAIQLIRNSIKDGGFLNTLRLNLEYQESSIRNLKDTVEKIRQEERTSIESPLKGYITSINFVKIRNIFSDIYSKDTSIDKFNSPIGIILKAREGTAVNKGDTIMEIRFPPERLSEYAEDIGAIISVSSDAPTSNFNKRIYGVVGIA